MIVFGRRIPPLALGILLMIFFPLFFASFIAPLIRQSIVPPVTYTVAQGRGTPYRWPTGCEKKDYHGKIEEGTIQSRKADAISPTCANEKYYLGGGAEYGWVRPGRGWAEYYRVGNDAVDLRCFDGNTCEVRSLYRNVFL